MRSTLRFAAISTIASALVVPSPSLAQIGLPRGGDAASVQLELMKPFFKDADFGFATSVLDASVAVPIRERLSLFARLGLSYATLERVTGSTESSSTLSNPRIGVLLGGQELYGEAHVDLPLAGEYGDDDFATGIGIVTDYERQERFTPDYWSLGGAATYERPIESGTVLGTRLGGTLVIPTDDAGNTDSESIALLAAFVRVLVARTRLGGEFSGAWIVTQPQLDFGASTTGYLTLSASLPEAAAAPEAYARIPLDDDLGDLAFVLGIRVRFGG